MARPPEPIPIEQPIGSQAGGGPPSWREIFAERARLTIGLIILEMVTAVQLLIVITIMPVIVADLGGLRLYGWAFAASAIAAIVALPATGRAADRWGPAQALTAVLGVFLAGTALAAAAPTMPIFIVGRFLQGWGLGAQYAVSLGAVAKIYPDAHRPRILALLSAAWVAPGLVGPSVGALIASTIGWRWAFLTSLPFVLLSAVLVLPELGGVPRAATRAIDPVGLGWLVLLAGGAAALIYGLTDLVWWTAPLAVAGSAMLVPALRQILPSGTFGARPGLPSAVAASFLLSFAFFGIDGFIPLMLTKARGLSVAWAGLVVTLASVSWAVGSWWASRVAPSRSRAWLVGAGNGLILVGAIAVASGLAPGVPLELPYAGWAIAGFGMGLAFTVIFLVGMERAEPGRQTQAVAAVQLADALGASLGPGLAGSALALAAARGSSITTGLAVAFALPFAVGLALVVVARRLPHAPASVLTVDSREGQPAAKTRRS